MKDLGSEKLTHYFPVTQRLATCPASSHPTPLVIAVVVITLLTLLQWEKNNQCSKGKAAAHHRLESRYCIQGAQHFTALQVQINGCLSPVQQNCVSPFYFWPLPAAKSELVSSLLKGISYLVLLRFERNLGHALFFFLDLFNNRNIRGMFTYIFIFH